MANRETKGNVVPSGWDPPVAGGRSGTAAPWRVEPLERRQLMAAQQLLATAGSSYSDFVSLGGTTYFLYENAAQTDYSLYKTNGTTAGTALVKDLGVAPNNNVGLDLVTDGTSLYFNAGGLLWKSGGTAATTATISGAPTPVQDLTPDGNGNLFLAHFNYVSASVGGGDDSMYEYSSGGTFTKVVTYQYPSSGFAPEGPNNLISVNGSIFFVEAVSPGPFQLFRYNGTPNSVTQVTHQTDSTGSIGQYPFEEFVLNNKLYFAADDYADPAGQYTTHLYVVNADGTGLTTGGLTPNGVSVSFPSTTPTVVGTTLYFTRSTSATGNQIWRTDLTAGGATQVTAFNEPGTAQYDNANGYGEDGLGGVSLQAVGSNVFFSGDFGTTAGVELGVVNAANPTGALVKDIWPGTGTYGGVPGANWSEPADFAAANGKLYFTAYPDDTHKTIWQSDGTGGGTTQADAVNSPNADQINGVDNGPRGLTGIGSTVYFFLPTGTSGTNNPVVPYALSAATVVSAPTANSQTVAVAHDTAKGITLTGSDPNTPPLSLTYTVTAGPAHGTLSGTAPNLTYTPAAGYHGSDSFTFTDSNGSATSPAATVTLNVAAGTPVGNAQSVNVAHNAARAITLTASDDDAPALTLTYAIGTSPAHGTLSGTAPNLTYTPAAGYHGSDSFTFTASNGTNTSAAATVSLTVAVGVPTATPQSVAVGHGTARAITLTATDDDGPALTLTYAVATSPAHGTLSGTAPNLTYTPAAGYHGSDSFTFTASNGTNASAAATVSLTVAVGTPTANGQSVNVMHDAAAAVTLTAADDDAPALSLTYAVATSPAHGTLSGTAPNLTYTPAAGYHGSDSFAFTASNGTNASAAATVSLTVAVGTPTANGQSVNVAHDAATAVTLTAADDDAPALALTYAVVTSPAHGTLSGTAPNLTYTPAAGYSGSDSFTFTASNGTNTSAAATVSLAVGAAAPTANSQSVGTAQNTAVAVTLTGSDPNTPPLSLTYAVTAGPSHGTLSGTAPNLTYTPAAGYSGADAFQFTASDGPATSAAATVSITVAAAAATTTAVASNPNPSVAGQAVTFTATVAVVAPGTGTPVGSVQFYVRGAPYGSPVAVTAGTTAGTAVATTTDAALPVGPSQITAAYTSGSGSFAGSVTTAAATQAVQQATVGATASVGWGTAGSATLLTNGDGLRLLPSGRTTDLPWLGINKLTITLSAAEPLTAADVSVTGVAVANYGPVTVSGSGTTYTIALAQPINAADRVTVTVGNAAVATYTRRLDVLPGDVNDDGAVASQDATLARNVYLGIGTPTFSPFFADVNGDGVVDANDYNLVRRLIGTRLP